MADETPSASGTTQVSPGELSLRTLLRSLTTTLSPETFIFATLPPSTPIPPSLPTQMTFREPAGTTLITTQEAASTHGLQAAFLCCMVTLAVHSSLDAVGFLAVVTSRLARLGVGVNPVSGFYHDHLFVPVGREEEVLKALEGLREEAEREGLLGEEEEN